MAEAKRAFTWKPKLRKLSLNRRKYSEIAYNFELRREKRSIIFDENLSRVVLDKRKFETFG